MTPEDHERRPRRRGPTRYSGERRGAGRPARRAEHVVEHDADEHRDRRDGREDVVVKLRAHEREEREGEDEPHAEQHRGVGPRVLAVASSRRSHHRRPSGREPRPREERVAELPHVEAEARVVALVRVVNVGERAVEHVVEDQPVGERRPVAHVHRDVPGQRDREDDQQAADDLELRRARARAARGARRRLRSGRDAARYAQRHEHGQAEARGALAERRDRREKPPAKVGEAADASLAPAQVEEPAEHRRPEEPLQQPARSPPTSAPEHASDGVGVAGDRVRNARGLRDTAILVAGQAAVAAARAAPELVPVRVEAVGARAPEELDVARQQVEDLRERADEHRAEDEVPRREPEAQCPGPSPRTRASRASRACADRA